MIIIAPIIQIIISVLRIYDRTKLPLSAIGVLTALLGVFLSFQTTSMVTYHLPNSHATCGILSAAFLIGGVMITFVATPVIGIISYLVYRYKHPTPVE